jgi:ribosome biogenesis GTPase
MYPGLNLRVGALSASVDKGRHTTVGAFMHPLPDGGFVVDTPGLREVGLWGLPSHALDDCFPEMRARRGDCRFPDCRHVSEPGCAVLAALAAGEVSEDRYRSYRTMLEEAREAERTW